jgi:hypothetical protein
VDADAAARMIVALAVGLLLQGLLDPQETDWAVTASQSMQILKVGIGRGEK